MEIIYEDLQGGIPYYRVAYEENGVTPGLAVLYRLVESRKNEISDITMSNIEYVPQEGNNGGQERKEILKKKVLTPDEFVSKYLDLSNLIGEVILKHKNIHWLVEMKAGSYQAAVIGNDSDNIVSFVLIMSRKDTAKLDSSLIRNLTSSKG